jgi:hypothetical protein
MTRLRSITLRQFVMIAFGAVAFFLLPWTAFLSLSLSSRHAATHWDLAWTGFDIGLAVLFGATAVAAYRRSPWVGAFAASLGTLLLVDAWFDIVLESHADERRNSIMLAVLAEVPMAVACFWIAYRTERFLSRVVEEAEELHLPATGESAPESDLVGVFEVPPDGKAAGESRDADAAA